MKFSFLRAVCHSGGDRFPDPHMWQFTESARDGNRRDR